MDSHPETRAPPAHGTFFHGELTSMPLGFYGSRARPISCSVGMSHSLACLHTRSGRFLLSACSTRSFLSFRRWHAEECHDDQTTQVACGGVRRRPDNTGGMRRSTTTRPDSTGGMRRSATTRRQHRWHAEECDDDQTTQVACGVRRRGALGCGGIGGNRKTSSVALLTFPYNHTTRYTASS